MPTSESAIAANWVGRAPYSFTPLLVSLTLAFLSVCFALGTGLYAFASSRAGHFYAIALFSAVAVVARFFIGASPPVFPSMPQTPAAVFAVIFPGWVGMGPIVAGVPLLTYGARAVAAASAHTAVRL